MDRAGDSVRPDRAARGGDADAAAVGQAGLRPAG